MTADDGDRVYDLLPLLGFAFITTVEAVHAAGKLKEDSESKDLGLVMTLFLNWTPDDLADGEDAAVNWRETVVGYARKANIDLEAIRPRVMKDVLEENKKVNALGAAPKNKAADRWGFKKMLASYKKKSGLCALRPFYGGPTFDITKWSRAERAKHAFDKKDPLADITTDVLKNNGIMFGGMR